MKELIHYDKQALGAVRQQAVCGAGTYSMKLTQVPAKVTCRLCITEAVQELTNRKSEFFRAALKRMTVAEP